jgi:hypothetical protein
MSSNGSMFRRLLVFALLAGTCGFSQVYPGGGRYPGGVGYPGGGYPPGQGPYPQGGGGPFPGGRRSRVPENQSPPETLIGTLRSISNKELVLETEEKTIVTVQIASSTKYYKPSPDATKPVNAKKNEFQPGDHLNVEAAKDDSNYFHALKVTLERPGNATERAAASRPVDSAGAGANAGASTPGDDDPDRPRLRRQSNGNDSSTEPTAGKTQTAPTDSDRSETVSSRPATTVDPPVTHRDPDDQGPPVLRRGKPAPRPDSESSRGNEPVSATARPSVHADEVNGVTRLPQPPAPETQPPSASPQNASSAQTQIKSSGDPVIDQARQAAFSFSQTLPNYVVKQFTTRFETEAARGGQTSWRPIDNVTADVVSEGGKETYKNILINGKPPREAVEKTGSWSTGEYSSVLQDILSPATDADFHNKRATTISNHAAFRYDFSVEKANSHWTVSASSQSYVPEYTGSIWVDKENYRVLRIELAARNMPKTFPLDTVESAIDYDFVPIGEGRFLLPVHSEALSCVRGTSSCSRNTIDFRNYKKFTADTTVTFEPDPN